MIHAYHVILPVYGFWLPNDPRGSWSEVVRKWELAVSAKRPNRCLVETYESFRLLNSASETLLDQLSSIRLFASLVFKQN